MISHTRKGSERILRFSAPRSTVKIKCARTLDARLFCGNYADLIDLNICPRGFNNQFPHSSLRPNLLWQQLSCLEIVASTVITQNHICPRAVAFHHFSRAGFYNSICVSGKSFTQSAAESCV